MSSPDKIFDALSSTPRRRILAYISEGPLTAGEIASRFDMSQPAISKHLTVLQNAGLVWRKREGQFIKYGMESGTLQTALAGFLHDVCPPSRALKKERREEQTQANSEGSSLKT